MTCLAVGKAFGLGVGAVHENNNNINNNNNDKLN